MSESVRARVRSIERLSSPQGQRFYCVFQVPGRADFAFWSPDVGQFAHLEVGSEVPLVDNGSGQLQLDPLFQGLESERSSYPSRLLWGLL
ncbi:MAG: hypothetical protein ACFB9N_05585 [Geitlerinemataceae cyanobacterium]